MNIRSDLYLMSILEIPEEIEDRGKTSYRRFLEKARKPYPATYPTMRRWFGLHGFTTPNREQAYGIAFSLELSPEELNNLLTKGLLETGVQYNDYKEIIFLYGLANHRSYEEALGMIDEFEGC
ncbi:MAG: hypothetical protein Q4D32_12715, partial [Eubacteriales bacterium]|nr:hypothetical protein [Eubacteriales bacterium]